MTSRLTQIISRFQRNPASSIVSRSLGSNTHSDQDEDNNGVYVSKNDQQQESSALKPHTEKEIDAEIMRFNAKRRAHDKIRQGEFPKVVTEEDVEMIVSDCAENIYAGKSLTVEEKREAAKAGVGEALTMFKFLPNQK